MTISGSEGLLKEVTVLHKPRDLAPLAAQKVGSGAGPSYVHAKIPDPIQRVHAKIPDLGPTTGGQRDASKLTINKADSRCNSFSE